MKIKRLISIQRLVGKVDNDFNISESDWIPRVAAWVIDALSQMKVLPMEKKRRTLEVSERIALFPCDIVAHELKVFDKNGNEISNGAEDKCNSGCNNSSTGGIDTIGVSDEDKNDWISNRNWASSTTLAKVVIGDYSRKFYLDGNNIELNFDTDNIIVESYEIATYHDEYYDCEVPYIYDNGTLLEALSWYILFKYLSRGSSHPVYDLKSTNAYTNPFTQWTLFKYKAKASVLKDLTNEKDEGWNNFFYNSTFLPRD